MLGQIIFWCAKSLITNLVSQCHIFLHKLFIIYYQFRRILIICGVFILFMFDLFPNWIYWFFNESDDLELSDIFFVLRFAAVFFLYYRFYWIHKLLLLLCALFDDLFISIWCVFIYFFPTIYYCSFYYRRWFLSFVFKWGAVIFLRKSYWYFSWCFFLVAY